MWAFSLTALLLPLLVASTPVPVPNPEALQTAASDAFANFPVNVILTAGAAQFGMWVPVNGFWYATSALRCLNAGANSYGSCAIPSADRIGVIAGNGPCSIIGSNGFQRTLTGNAGDGWASIAPPQQITWISCGDSSYSSNSTKRST